MLFRHQERGSHFLNEFRPFLAQELALRRVFMQRQTGGGDHAFDPLARLNDHEPYAYLKDVLTRLPTYRAS